MGALNRSVLSPQGWGPDLGQSERPATSFRYRSVAYVGVAGVLPRFGEPNCFTSSLSSSI